MKHISLICLSDYLVPGRTRLGEPGRALCAVICHVSCMRCALQLGLLHLGTPWVVMYYILSLLV